MNGKRQRYGLGAATALEQADDELLTRRFEQQTQRRRRGLAGAIRRTEDEQQHTAGLGSKLQAAKQTRLGVGQPGDDGANAFGSQSALTSPGSVAAGSTGDQQA